MLISYNYIDRYGGVLYTQAIHLPSPVPSSERTSLHCPRPSGAEGEGERFVTSKA